MIAFIVLQFLGTRSTTISIILLVLMLLNMIGFIRANSKNVKEKGVTIEDQQKFKHK